MKRSSNADLLDHVKRRRSTDTEDEVPTDTTPLPTNQFPRLVNAAFPVEIAALMHVLKQLDELLMTPEEAIVEASATGQLKWGKSITKRFAVPLGMEEAVVMAATNGHLLVVAFLLDLTDLDDVYNLEWSVAERDIVKKAAISAAANGHYEVVRILLPAASDVPDDGYDSPALAPLQKIIGPACKKGHLDIVELILEEIKELNKLSKRLA